MENILFLMAYSLDDGQRHLTQKFDSQISAAERLGYNAWYTAFARGNVYLCNKESKINLGKSFNNPQNILQCHYIFKKIKKIFEIQKFDLCYIRAVTPIPSYLKALRIIKKQQCKVVVEIPTYPTLKEKENSSRKFFYFVVSIFSKLYGGKVACFVDLYTLIGESADSYKGVRAINIQNGVHIDAFPLKKKAQHPDNELHLLAVACMSYWHAYDRVIEGLKDYYKHPRSITVYLHLVGNSRDGSLERWKEISIKYGLNKNVIFEGFKARDELNHIFNQCDIALGSFGLYRQKLNTASSIKIAEYCARGIPFVYAGKNGLIPNEQLFCMQVPNDSSVIGIERILEFWEEIKDSVNIQTVMRNYAINNISWEKQLKKIIDALGLREDS